MVQASSVMPPVGGGRRCFAPLRRPTRPLAGARLLVVEEVDVRLVDDARALHRLPQAIGPDELTRAVQILDLEEHHHLGGVVRVAEHLAAGGPVLLAERGVIVEDRPPSRVVLDTMADEKMGHENVLPRSASRLSRHYSPLTPCARSASTGSG